MPTISGIVVATSAEASGRRTLLEVVDELARPVNAADETVRAIAADSFRAAVRTMNRKGCWPWEVMDEDLSLAAETKTTTLTSAVKKPLAMYLLESAGGDENKRLVYVPYGQLLESYSLFESGEPQRYSLPNLFETGAVRWHPTPAAAYSARFHFYRVTPAPRDETETIEVPDYATEAYMAFARWEMVKRLPRNQAYLTFSEAHTAAQLAFRELSAHVVSATDGVRESA